MPQFVKYINFRATIPGDHKPGTGRNCMGYPFREGKFEARLSEADARVAHSILTTYFGATTEEVADAPLPEQNKIPGAPTKQVATVDGKGGAATGDGAKAPALKRNGTTEPKTGKGKPKTAKSVGQKGSGNPGSPKTTDLV